jgi:hypothetical protein
MSHRHVHFRITESQYQFLTSLGEQSHLPMAAVVRQLIREAMAARHRAQKDCNEPAERKNEVPHSLRIATKRS